MIFLLLKQFFIIYLGLGCIPHAFSQEQFQENKAPEVKFIFPNDNDTLRWNDFVSYEISIVDREDGETKYDEIDMKEVFLVVKYLNDSLREEDYLISETKMNYEPLVEMGSRSCFNCHKVYGTLIGPSYNEIAEKYKKVPKSIDILAKKIIDGGSNVWGEEIMPSHPDLNISQSKKLVEWILTYNFIAEKEILIGTKGSFRIKKLTEKLKSGIYVLTAFYTDHGFKGNLQGRKRGQETITIKLE
jgi:cytochrome c